MQELDIIVPTLNSERTLPVLLESIQNSDVKPHCVWIADGGSTDRTRRIADAFGAKFCAINPEKTEAQSAKGPSGYAFAKNELAKRADSEFILFLDSDMEMRGGLTNEVAHALVTGADAVIVPEETMGHSLIARARSWERKSPEKSGIGLAPRAFRRASFVELGGYRTDMSGLEDLELAVRAENFGLRIVQCSTGVLHHEGELTLRQYVRKRARYASASADFGRLHTKEMGRLTSPRNRIGGLLSNLRADPDLESFLLTFLLRSGEGLLIFANERVRRKSSAR